MMSRTRRHLGTLHAESVEIFPKSLDKRSGKIVNADILFCRLVYNAVVNVGQIKNVRYIVASELQIAPQNIAKNKRPKIADMSKIPNRGPADIHSDFASLDRLKFLDGTR